MHKKLFPIIIFLFLTFFCFSGCYQMGRMAGKAENQIEKVGEKIEDAGDNFERGYNKEKND